MVTFDQAAALTEGLSSQRAADKIDLHDAQ